MYAVFKVQIRSPPSCLTAKRKQTRGPCEPLSTAHGYESVEQANSTQVGLSGLEPPTSRLSGVRSNLLSYKPISEV